MTTIKLLALTLLIAVLALAGFRMLPPRITQAQISIPVTSYDFGDVAYGDIPSHEFAVRNEGGAPLEIKKISTSCGCTTAEIADKTIAPGEEAVLTVFFNPAIHGDDTDLGELTRVVYLTTNDPQAPETEVTIRANVYKK